MSSYACNKSWHGYILVEILNQKGELITNKKIQTKPSGLLQDISKFDVLKLFHNLDLTNSDKMFCKISMDAKNNFFPDRFKLGLDYSRNKLARFGTNICFSPFKYSANIRQKPFGSFWGPLGGSEGYLIYFHNTDFSKSKKEANYKVNYKIINYLGKIKEKEILLCEDETLILNCFYDKELNDFLHGNVGWVFFQSENVFSNGCIFL